ncbi:MAG: hypothetical protein HQM08_26915 [Candidatus Riflebacteria bacterium]|nr:hypothetical protein [Candidatus Riflebacteria bacterium]
MKKLVAFSVLIVGFIILTLVPGCLWNSSDSPPNPDDYSRLTSSPTSVSEKTSSVQFQIILSNSQPAPTKSLRISPETRAGVGTSWATATFQITLLNPGDAASPTTILLQVVPVIDGTASATFYNVPIHTAIGSIHIDGGNIAGHVDFHGAADLSLNLPNTLLVVPTNGHSTIDVIATILERIIITPSVFEKIQPGLASQAMSLISGLDLNSPTIATDAFMVVSQSICNTTATNTITNTATATAFSTNTSTGIGTGTSVSEFTPVPLETRLDGLNQNVQVIVSNVPSNFVTSVQMTDGSTEEQFLLSKSSAMSFPNFQRLVLAAKGMTLRNVASFDTLLFSTVPPAGAEVFVFNPETANILASLTIPGWGASVPLGLTLNETNQDLQVIMTNVPQTSSPTVVMFDKQTCESVRLVKNAALSYPNYQQLVLTSADSAARCYTAFSSLMFDTSSDSTGGLVEKVHIEVYDPDTKTVLASFDVPSKPRGQLMLTR